MNPSAVIAVLLIAGIGAAHSYLGERYILVRLFKRELPSLFGSDVFTRQTLRFAWHLTTIAWLGFAGILLIATGSPVTPLRIGAGQVIAGTFVASAVLSVVMTRGRHLSWPVFLAIALASWWALAAV